MNRPRFDCTLVSSTGSQPAIRLGLRMVKGLRREGAQRLVAARQAQPFADVADLVTRTGLDPRDWQALAKADALRSLVGHQRAALWQTLGIEHARADALLPATTESVQNDLFAKPQEGEDVLQDYDYASTGLTLRRHPLALLRTRLAKMRLAPASVIARSRHGQLIRTTGIVTCRQTPATANGIIFVTLEDETGMINVIVWTTNGERFRKELLTARLLAVFGTIERQGPTVHVVAGMLRDDSALLGALRAASRNFM